MRRENLLQTKAKWRVGIVRSEEGLKQALQGIEKLEVGEAEVLPVALKAPIK